jgi:hypothetical protein
VIWPRAVGAVLTRESGAPFWLGTHLGPWTHHESAIEIPKALVDAFWACLEAV